MTLPVLIGMRTDVVVCGVIDEAFVRVVLGNRGEGVRTVDGYCFGDREELPVLHC
jgi:hypothetical protein